jgi:hypothetical protein
VEEHNLATKKHTPITVKYYKAKTKTAYLNSFKMLTTSSTSGNALVPNNTNNNASAPTNNNMNTNYIKSFNVKKVALDWAKGYLL